jgi:unsaturated chondroitin disaccharide hydrolase
VHINLLGRALEHAATTARYNVYFGEGRDAYDVPGRVAHESIFNTVNGQYRCPSTQQGYSPFSTWTRGAAWIILGYAEQLEFLNTVVDEELAPYGGREAIEALFVRVLRATCDYYIGQQTASLGERRVASGYSCLDGIPYWDTGAPGLAQLGDYQQSRSDPHNAYEPVDSSAAAIAAQGLVRMGHYLASRGEADAARYLQAGLTIAQTLMTEPYLSTDPRHEGLLLHALYHRPNGWDHIPTGRKAPCDESCMWGDYHLLELALLTQRMGRGEYLTFF